LKGGEGMDAFVLAVAAVGDAAIVAAAGYAALAPSVRKTVASILGARAAVALAGAALAAVAAFYALDLWTVFFTSLITAPAEALEARATLHARFGWPLHAVALGLAAAAVATGVKRGRLGVAPRATVQGAYEKEARRAAELFDLATRACKAGTMEWSLQGDGEQRWSDNFFRLLGYEPGECPATHAMFVSLMHPDDVARADAAVTEQFLQGKFFEIEFRLKHRSGAYRWFAATNQVVAEDGVPHGMLGTITDIHELKAAQESAEAANVAKSRFLANMSHEVRTPMNAILGFASVLRGTELVDDQREYVETICTSGEQLLRLINEILDLSKIEAGAITLQEESFALADVIHDVLTLAKPQLRGVAVALDSRLDPDVPARVLGDYGRLRQILLNLVSNAAKFTHEGRITVTATLAPASDAEGVTPVRIAVVDTGIGIDDELLARVFEPFVQADGTHTRNYGGAGLGLTICRDLVRLMGGTLDAESEVGRGSAFVVTIPFRATPAHAGTSGSSMIDRRPRGAPQPAPAPRVARVLVVDDDEPNRALMRAAFAPAGFEVAVAANGEEALRIFAASSIDLVLMDVHLPEMDGMQAAAGMRALQGSSVEIPVVAVTADAMDGDRERYLAAGFDDYLSKPIDLVALVETARRWTEAPAAARAPSAPRVQVMAPPLDADAPAGAPAAERASFRTLRHVRNPDGRFAAIVTDDLATGVIRLSWVNDPASVAVVREVHEVLLSYLETGRYAALLLDGRFLTQSFKEADAWIYSEFVPRMFASGIVRKAVALPRSASSPGGADVHDTSMRSMETLASVPRYRDSGVEVMGFEDVERAMSWLAQTPRVRRSDSAA
jgi:PAS domain S-box-containing protein